MFDEGSQGMAKLSDRRNYHKNDGWYMYLLALTRIQLTSFTHISHGWRLSKNGQPRWNHKACCWLPVTSFFQPTIHHYRKQLIRSVFRPNFPTLPHCVFIPVLCKLMKGRPKHDEEEPTSQGLRFPWVTVRGVDYWTRSTRCGHHLLLQFHGSNWWWNSLVTTLWCWYIHLNIYLVMGHFIGVNIPVNIPWSVSGS